MSNYSEEILKLRKFFRNQIFEKVQEKKIKESYILQFIEHSYSFNDKMMGLGAESFFYELSTTGILNNNLIDWDISDKDYEENNEEIRDLI